MIKADKENNIFGALKLIEQLYLDGEISRLCVLETSFKNTRITFALSISLVTKKKRKAERQE